MEKEIADILLRGELPILPPESFVSNKDEGGEEESGQYDSSSDISKEKQRKIKRKQFFRRQGLKRQKEKARLMAATPSFDFNAYTESSFSRKNHDLQVRCAKENEIRSELDVQGKTEEELLQLIEEQQKQIDSLEKENDKLHLAVYRLKKHLTIVSTM